VFQGQNLESATCVPYVSKYNCRTSLREKAHVCQVKTFRSPIFEFASSIKSAEEPIITLLPQCCHFLLGQLHLHRVHRVETPGIHKN
jgi:hypothetical protein